MFVAIVHRGSVSAAADQIGMTQSAASMALADLERHLQGLLFDRVGKQLQLSRFGESQLKKAEHILAQAQSFEHGIDNTIAGSLEIASSMTIGSYLLPSVLTGFLQQNPEIELSLPLSNTQQVIDKITHFEADIGFIEGKCNNTELASITWMQDSLIAFASIDSEWVKSKGDPAKLLASPWILRESGSVTRAVLERALGQQRDQLNIFLELASHEAIKQVVLSGLGIGCLSELVIKQELQQGQLIDLSWSELNLKRDLSLIWHPNRYLSPAAKLFIKTLSLQKKFEQAV